MSIEARPTGALRCPETPPEHMCNFRGATRILILYRALGCARRIKDKAIASTWRLRSLAAGPEQFTGAAS
jgi:hypothetical protein